MNRPNCVCPHWALSGLPAASIFEGGSGASVQFGYRPALVMDLVKELSAYGSAIVETKFRCMASDTKDGRGWRTLLLLLSRFDRHLLVLIAQKEAAKWQEYPIARRLSLRHWAGLGDMNDRALKEDAQGEAAMVLGGVVSRCGLPVAGLARSAE